MLGKLNQALIEAVKKGYKAIDGKVFYNDNELKLSLNTCGYYTFGVRYNKQSITIKVHRLVAYQKYGKKLFNKKWQVRHLDNNKLNNKEENLLIGTNKQNMQDKPLKQRLESAILASSYVKIHNHDKAIALRQKGYSYENIMKKLGINSKGTLSFIINKSISANKIKKVK